MGDFAITKELKAAFAKRNISNITLRNATAEEFYRAIGRAKEMNPHGAFVTQHTIAEYEQMQLFLNLHDTAGIAITSDNNIVSIFNCSRRRGALKTLLPVAIGQGGRKLDNFNHPKLSALYELYGFKPVSRVKFDRMFAPDDWNYERDGEPDIVFWIHNGDSAEEVVLNFGQYVVSWGAVAEFNTYAEAEKYRDDLIDQIDNEDTDAF